jgi:hypothetical protein
MNKRFLHLFNEAGFHQPEMERLGIEHKFERFAELIVRECVSIVENSRIEGDEGVCLVGATKCKIEQHFGVENE